MCIQCLFKINCVSYYLPITDIHKLSDWIFGRNDCFRLCFSLLMVLVSFVDGVLQSFQVQKYGFCGESTLFGGSFDILLNLNDISILT